MNQVHHYQEIWKLKTPKLLYKTPTSDIYQVQSPNGKSILKVFSTVGKEDEKGGLLFFNCFNGYPTAKVFAADENATLLEFLEGPNLYTFSRQKKEELASAVFVELILEIQRAKVDHKLESFSKLFKVLNEKEINQNNSSFERAQFWAKELLASQTREVVLHGDLHHENILKNKQDRYVCFDPKGYRGDPAYELATTLKNPWDYPDISENITIFKERLEYLSRELRLDKERVFKFTYVHLCLSILWAKSDNTSPTHQLNLLKKIEKEYRL